MTEQTEQAAAEHWLTVSEAAKIAGVTTKAIRDWVKRGKVTYRRAVNGRAQILESSLFPDGVKVAER